MIRHLGVRKDENPVLLTSCTIGFEYRLHNAKQGSSSPSPDSSENPFVPGSGTKDCYFTITYKIKSAPSLERGFFVFFFQVIKVLTQK